MGGKNTIRTNKAKHTQIMAVNKKGRSRGATRANKAKSLEITIYICACTCV